MKFSFIVSWRGFNRIEVYIMKFEHRPHRFAFLLSYTTISSPALCNFVFSDCNLIFGVQSVADVSLNVTSGCFPIRIQASIIMCLRIGRLRAQYPGNMESVLSIVVQPDNCFYSEKNSCSVFMWVSACYCERPNKEPALNRPGSYNSSVRASWPHSDVIMKLTHINLFYEVSRLNNESLRMLLLSNISRTETWTLDELVSSRRHVRVKDFYRGKFGCLCLSPIHVFMNQTWEYRRASNWRFGSDWRL